MATQNISFFNKYGFCKYIDRCRKYHESKNCENSSCEIRECVYRHPKTCKFFRDFGFCKFSEWCKFSHKVDRNTTEKNDNVKILETKLINVEKELEKKNVIISKLEEELQKMNLKLSENEETLRKIIKKLNVLNERETFFVESKDRIEKLEKSVENLMTRSEKKADENKCEKCEFVAKNEQGLKVHMKAKHIEHNRIKCWKCDFTCATKSELNEHNDTDY